MDEKWVNDYEDKLVLAILPVIPKHMLLMMLKLYADNCIFK